MPGDEAKISFTEREYKELNLDDATWDRYRQVLSDAGLVAVVRQISVTSVCKMFKIYAAIKNGNPEKAKGVILGTDPLTREDMEDAIRFYENHAIKDGDNYIDQNGNPIDMSADPIVVNNTKIDELVEVQHTYVKAVNDLITAEDLGEILPDGDSLWDKADQLDNYNMLYIDSSQAFEYLTNPRKSRFKDMFALKREDEVPFSTRSTIAYMNNNAVSVGAEGGYALALGASIVKNQLAPILQNKSLEDIDSIFPAAKGRDSYIALIAETAWSIGSAFPKDVTEEEVKYFQVTGELPERLQAFEGRAQEFSDMALGNTESLYRNGWNDTPYTMVPIAEYNRVVPNLIDHKGVPAFEDAARKIANDAKKLMESELGGELGENKDKILSHYADIVENQLKRYLLEDGYARKCKAMNAADLDAEIKAFVEGDGKKLPANISQDAVSKALAAGLNGVRFYYPEQTPALDKLDAGKLSFVDQRGQLPLTVREELASSMIQDNEQFEGLSDSIKNAGLLTGARKGSALNIAKMYKIYAHPEQARDILLAKVPVTDADVREAQAFFEANKCTKVVNGVPSLLNEDGTWVNKESADVMAAVSNTFLKAYSSLDVEDIANVDDLQSIRENADVLNNLAFMNMDEGQAFPNIRAEHNGAVDYPADSRDRGRADVIFSLSSLLDNTVNPYAHDIVVPEYETALANSIMYRMIAPQLRGRTIDDLGRMYPVENGRDSYLTSLYMASTAIKAALPEKVTEQEFIEYQNTGRLPDGVDKALLQEAISGAIAQTEVTYAATNNSHRIAEYNKLVPIVVDHENVPDFEGAAKRIGQDAQILMQSRLGDDVPAEAKNKIAEDYGRLVENQLRRLIVEDGYIEKCKQAENHEQLEADVNAFVAGERVLPANISKNLVTRAEMLATEGVMRLHNAYAGVINELPVGILSPEYDDVPSTSLDLPAPEAIEDIYQAPAITAETAAQIRRFDISYPNARMNATAGAAFDDMIRSNPALSANAGSAAVNECEGDVTKLFYIDGMRVDDYLRTVAKTYDAYSEEEKQTLAKAAIMQSIVSDRRRVDVKTYVQTPDGKCEARVNNVVSSDRERSARGFFRRWRSSVRARDILAADKSAAEINSRTAEFAGKAARSKLMAETAKRIKENNDAIAAEDKYFQMNLGKDDFDAEASALEVKTAGGDVSLSVMYNLYEQQKQGRASAREVLLNEPAGMVNHHMSGQFFNDHELTTGLMPLADGNRHQLIDEVLAIEENYMRTANSTDLSAIVSLDNIDDVTRKGYEINRMKQTSQQFKDFFANYNKLLTDTNNAVNAEMKAEYTDLARTYSYYTKTIDMLDDMTFGKGMSEENVQKAFVATLMYNAIGPALNGKTPEQLQKMYPAFRDKTYLDFLSEDLTAAVGDYAREYGITQSDVIEFQRSGALPAGVSASRFQQMYDQALEQARRRYVAGGGKLEAANEAKPQFIDKTAAPFIDRAAKKIAADAMASLEVQYEKLNGKQVDVKYEREYGRLVGEQIKALLIKDGYADKCRNAASTDEVQSNMQQFLAYGGKLPYNITKEIVDQATKNALEQLNTLYPDNKESVEKFNSELNYDNAGAQPESSVSVVGLGTYRAPSDVDTAFKSTAAHDQIVESIRKLDFTVQTAKNMVDATKEFDNFLGYFPGYAESLNNPEVSKSCNGQVTNLFYIDGKPVAEYLEAIIPGYKNSTAANKENLAKAAIMKAIIDGKPPVDALYYAQDGKGNCSLNVRNIVYKGNFNSMRRAKPGKLKENQADEKRLNDIYKANVSTLSNIIKSVKEKFRTFTAESAARANRLGIAPRAVSVIPDTLKETKETEARENVKAVEAAELNEDIEKIKANELKEELVKQESERLAKQEAEKLDREKEEQEKQKQQALADEAKQNAEKQNEQPKPEEQPAVTTEEQPEEKKEEKKEELKQENLADLIPDVEEPEQKHEVRTDDLSDLIPEVEEQSVQKQANLSTQPEQETQPAIKKVSIDLETGAINEGETKEKKEKPAGSVTKDPAAATPASKDKKAAPLNRG